MEQKEFLEQVGKLITDNPAKFIKIRAALDDIFEGHSLDSAKAISDREFEKIKYKFEDIDVPFIWCNNKEAVYQLYKAVKHYREQSRKREQREATKKKPAKAKKGLFGLFG